MRDDRAIFIQDLIRQHLDEFHRVRVEFRLIQVNRAGVRAEMKRDGFGVAEAQKDLRKQMLAGVLLHKVKAAFPINLPLRLAFRDRAFEQMENAAFIVFHHVHDRRVVQPAEIVRLSARCGIKSGLI